MATFDWPEALTPASVTWAIQKAGTSFRSPMAGSLESVEFPGQFWKVSVTLPDSLADDGGRAESFFARLAGGTERVRVPYWRRLIPKGTMRGSPTLQAGAVRGDLQLLVNATGTLEYGDMIGVGSQLFQVFDRCSSVSGTLTVPLVNRVRATLAISSPVVWYRPTVTCIVPSNSSGTPFGMGIMSGMPVDLEEAP